jgi:hypothetical protein
MEVKFHLQECEDAQFAVLRTPATSTTFEIGMYGREGEYVRAFVTPSQLAELYHKIKDKLGTVTDEDIIRSADYRP